MASAQPARGSLPLSGIKTGIGFRDGRIAWLYRTREAGHAWHTAASISGAYVYKQGVT